MPKKLMPTVLSRFNVLFFGIFATTQILGNMVTSLVIRDGVTNNASNVLAFQVKS